jgi:hypothetical protein
MITFGEVMLIANLSFVSPAIVRGVLGRCGARLMGSKPAATVSRATVPANPVERPASRRGKAKRRPEAGAA